MRDSVPQIFSHRKRSFYLVAAMAAVTLLALSLPAGADQVDNETEALRRTGKAFVRINGLPTPDLDAFKSHFESIS